MGLLVFNTGCRTARESDLPGKYSVKTDWGESTLVLRPDHSMEQVVQTKRGEVKKASGTWELVQGNILSVKPCLEVLHDRGGRLVDGCYTTATVWPNHVEVDLDPDYGLAYSK